MRGSTGTAMRCFPSGMTTMSRSHYVTLALCQYLVQSRHHPQLQLAHRSVLAGCTKSPHLVGVDLGSKPPRPPCNQWDLRGSRTTRWDLMGSARHRPSNISDARLLCEAAAAQVQIPQAPDPAASDPAASDPAASDPAASDPASSASHRLLRFRIPQDLRVAPAVTITCTAERLVQNGP
jgi:hypothetical protein